MSQFNRITTRCLPSRWCGVALVQAVTGAPLVWAQFTGGRHPVVAGGERLVGKHRVVSARVPIDRLSAYVIISGNPPPMLVLDQNKPTWSTVNQWAPIVNIVIFPLISIARP